MTKRVAIDKAGFAPSTKTWEIFGREDVKKEIQRRQDIMSTKAGINAEWIIERLMKIADADLSDLLVVHEDGKAHIDMNLLTPQLRVALGDFQSEGYGENVFKMRVKLADKIKALEMLARHLGMFNDKLELQGELSLEQRLQAGRNRASQDNYTSNDLENQS